MTQLPTPELAPAACIVCEKPCPLDMNQRPDFYPDEWFYLAGSTPLGAMACSPPCLEIAVARHARTGRVDRQMRCNLPVGMQTCNRALGHSGYCQP